MISRIETRKNFRLPFKIRDIRKEIKPFGVAELHSYKTDYDMSITLLPIFKYYNTISLNEDDSSVHYYGISIYIWFWSIEILAGWKNSKTKYKRPWLQTKKGGFISSVEDYKKQLENDNTTI